MDYKEKYKEALERARAFELPEYKNIVESIFPELAESEDERIRKDLIGFFKDEAFLCHKKEDILAWLKKQGGQKPADMVEPKDYSSVDPHFFKPTWSKEDGEKFIDVIRLVEQGASVQSMGDYYTNWLKSLKERITWKPSDEQMKMLHRSIVAIAPGVLHDGLESLYNDLKKLK